MGSAKALSAAQAHSRRLWIITVSLVCNLVLGLLAWSEWQRIAQCERNNFAKSVLEATYAKQTDLPLRRLLLERSSSVHLDYPDALELEQQASPPPVTGRTKRSLLGLSAAAPPTLGKIYPAPPASAALHIKGDLSDDPTFNVSSHDFTWHVCPLEANEYHKELRPFCPETAIAEQHWQMEWFSAHVVPGAPVRPFPTFLGCTNLPPVGYKWPQKAGLQFPATGPAFHYPNLRIEKLEDLIQFNRGTPKNLYHFDAPKYDLDALSEIKYAEQYIPFAKKIRLMLDVGAGGGSLGLLLKAKYDVQTLSTVFADWPYCEMITERGGNCILMDVMEAMPVAKFSFDVLHVSWVYHGQRPEELQVMFHELNRVLRPGGYMWLRGGWSWVQYEFLVGLMKSLGYVSLHSDIQRKSKDITEKVFFGGTKNTLPYALDWTAIFLKPIAKMPSIECSH